MKEDFISSSMAMGIRLPEKGAAPSALIGRSYTKDVSENSPVIAGIYSRLLLRQRGVQRLGAVDDGLVVVRVLAEVQAVVRGRLAVGRDDVERIVDPVLLVDLRWIGAGRGVHVLATPRHRVGVGFRAVGAGGVARQLVRTGGPLGPNGLQRIAAGRRDRDGRRGIGLGQERHGAPGAVRALALGVQGGRRGEAPRAQVR